MPDRYGRMTASERADREPRGYNASDWRRDVDASKAQIDATLANPVALAMFPPLWPLAVAQFWMQTLPRAMGMRTGR